MRVLTKRHIKGDWFVKGLYLDNPEEVYKLCNYYQLNEANYCLQRIRELLAKKDILILDYKLPLNPKLIRESRTPILKVAGFLTNYDVLNKSWDNNHEVPNNSKKELQAILTYITLLLEDNSNRSFEKKIKDYIRYQNRQIATYDSNFIVLQIDTVDFVYLLNLNESNDTKINIRVFDRKNYEKYYYSSTANGIVIPNYKIENGQIVYLENRVIEDGELVTIWDSKKNKVGEYLCEYIDKDNFFIDGVYMSVDDFADIIYNKNCRYSTRKPTKAYVYKL